MTPIVVGLALVVVAVAGIVALRERARINERFTAYFAAGRFEEALPFARRLAERPAQPLLRGRRQQNLASVLLKLERWEEAAAALEDALASQLQAEDPTALLTRANLAWLDLRAGRVERARHHAHAIEAREPGSARAGALLGAAALVEGKPTDARALLEPLSLAEKKQPGDGVALAVLAAALEATGETAGASEVARVARERLGEAQRRELAAILPRVFAGLER